MSAFARIIDAFPEDLHRTAAIIKVSPIIILQRALNLLNKAKAIDPNVKFVNAIYEGRRDLSKCLLLLELVDVNKNDCFYVPPAVTLMKYIHDKIQGFRGYQEEHEPFYISLFQIMFDQFANINALDYNGNTLLMTAIQIRRQPLVHFFVTMGCDRNIQNHKDECALHIATTIQNTYAIQLLIDVGCDITLRKRHGYTPLFIVSTGNYLPTTKFFLENHVPDIPKFEGQTALHFAGRFGMVEMVHLLLQYNVPVNPTDRDDKTPLDLAIAGLARNPFPRCQKNFADIIEMLQAASPV